MVMSGNSNNSSYKVGMVIDTFDDARNGAVISTQRFTRILRKNGHQVIIFTTGEPEPDKLILKEFYPPIPLVKGVMQRMKFTFAWPERQKIADTLKKIDVLHNQMPFFLSYRSINMARKAGIPVISTFHVQAEQIVNNVGLKRHFWVNLVYKFFIRFIYNQSDLLICPSQFAADEIKRYGCTTPTVVISNGVTEDYKVLDIPKTHPDKFVILTVGRNATEKRQELIIDAISRSKYKDQILLQIIGDGPLRQHLVQKSEELLDGKVEFYYLPPDEVINFYNTADLYVHAAAVEVECMTALEAMACGLPLLIANSELSATKQFAISENNLFTTLEELTQKIEYWYENRDALARSREEYLEFVKQYRIEQSYKKLDKAYQTVLQPKAVEQFSQTILT